jgi:ABC-type phosphate/phosphonate transport system substrate-binding protein
MYAFTPPLRQAWEALLKPLGEIIQEIDPEIDIGPIQIGFDSAPDTYLSSDLLLGHTCGYPYMSHWKQSHQLLAAPVFDIAGCKGTQYASWFICRSNDPRHSLESFCGATAALNAPNSNSGMNVLRHAVSRMARDGKFFNRTVVTGSHFNSLRALVIGDADIAAIDPVSYHHIMHSEPSLESAVKIFGQSIHTTGLPFITHRNQPISRALLLQALNQCVERSEHDALECLRLVRFSGVSESDYDALMKLESDAVSAGYPTLK